MKKLRALYLCPSPKDVGTYFRALAFSRHFFQHLGIEGDLLCSGDRDEEIWVDGIRVVTFRPSRKKLNPLRGFNLREIVARLRWIRQQKIPYNFVYTFEYQPSVVLPSAWVLKRDRPLHFNDWCDWYAGRHHRLGGIRFLQKADQTLEEWPRKRADFVTAICRPLFDRALSIGVKPLNLMLVREGAEFPKQMEARRTARENLRRASDDTFWIITLVDVGLETLIDGFLKFYESNCNAKLVIIGRLPETCIQDHPAILKQGRVSDEDLHLWLCASDVAWVALQDTALNQGRLPHKIGHFRSYGLTVITNPLSDIVHLEDPGLIFVPFQKETFAEKTLEFCDQIRTQDLRLMSQEEAKRIYSWDTLLAPLLAKLQQKLASCGDTPK